MAITFSCDHCGKVLTTTDDKAGRKAKCPGCGEVLTVPEPDDAGGFGLAADEDAGDDEFPPAQAPGRPSTGTKTCPMCGAENTRRAATCQACGEEFADAGDTRDRHERLEYAGFWLRFAAHFIDSILLGCVGFGIGMGVGVVLAVMLVAANNGNANGVGEGAQLFIQLVAQAISLFINWMYYAFMESSSKQATLGKMAVGIKVCDLDGRRMSFGRATGRYFAKILSAFTCLIGFIMAGFTERKQALHDILAGTLVVRA